MRRGFTLVESVVSIVVLGVVAAVIMPVLASSADNLASANEIRSAVDRAAFAMDRCVRLLRDVPAGATVGSVGITSASPTSVRFSDNTGLELTDGTLYLRTSATSTSPLCRDVSTFQIEYIASDGKTHTESLPTTTQRFNIVIITGGVELRCSALARAAAIGA